MNNEDNQVINNNTNEIENLENNIENIDQHIENVHEFINPTDVVLNLKDEEKSEVDHHIHEAEVIKEKEEVRKSNQLSVCFEEIKEKVSKIKSNQVNNSDSVYSENNFEIVIIGGGATGIYSAIQLRQRDFKGNIYIYERMFSHEHMSNIVKLPSKDDVLTRNKLIDDLFQKGEMEKGKLITLLRQQAEKLPNIFLLNYEVDNLSLLETLHPSSFIIHSNGTDSKTRNSILDEKGQTIEMQSKSLFNVIQIKYNVDMNKNTSKIGVVTSYHHQKIEKYLSEFASSIEQIVDVNDNKVIIRFYVDGYIFDAAKVYTRENPCNFNDLISDTELLRTKISDYITFYIKFRSYYNHETPKKEGFELITYKLNANNSSSYGGIIKDSISKNTHLLVGDSCFSLPFQRNLRNCFFAANHLTSIIMNIKEDNSHKGFLNLFESSILRRQLSKRPQVNDRVLDDYSKFIEEFIEEEILKARKFIFPSGFKAAYLKIASITPWEVNVIGDKIKGEVGKIEFI